ncbi:MAG TPA: hypothetical protein VFA90_03100 [Terriglobales bacterium]|nr:hypothetical protein [Terriglobales bacterium]
MAVRRVVNPDNDWMQADAVPTSGGPPVPLCSGWCGVDWTRDGKAMYFYWMSSWSNIRTYVVPIAHGTDLPNLPKNGFQSEDELRALHATEIDAAASPGPNQSSYSFSKRNSHWNLYRLPLQ